MKLAWEAAEPGRAAKVPHNWKGRSKSALCAQKNPACVSDWFVLKAHQTRLRYLKELQEHAESKEPVTAETGYTQRYTQPDCFKQFYMGIFITWPNIFNVCIL